MRAAFWSSSDDFKRLVGPPRAVEGGPANGDITNL